MRQLQFPLEASLINLLRGMKWKFESLIPFFLGQRLERDVKATPTKSKQIYIKNMNTLELIPYSGSIRISFTHTTGLVIASPGRTLRLLVHLTSTMRHLQVQRKRRQSIYTHNIQTGTLVRHGVLGPIQLYVSSRAHSSAWFPSRANHLTDPKEAQSMLWQANLQT